jgi:hypothetical protein
LFFYDLNFCQCAGALELLKGDGMMCISDSLQDLAQIATPATLWLANILRSLRDWKNISQSSLDVGSWNFARMAAAFIPFGSK